MPPKNTNPKAKRNRNMLIGAAAVGLLLLLYLRSRSQQPGNATSQTDLQTASMAAAQQQAAQDAAMYGAAPNYGMGGLDTTAISDAITQGFNSVALASTRTVGQPAGGTSPTTTTSAPDPNALKSAYNQGFNTAFNKQFNQVFNAKYNLAWLKAHPPKTGSTSQKQPTRR